MVLVQKLYELFHEKSREERQVTSPFSQAEVTFVFLVGCLLGRFLLSTFWVSFLTTCAVLYLPMKQLVLRECEYLKTEATNLQQRMTECEESSFDNPVPTVQREMKEAILARRMEVSSDDESGSYSYVSTSEDEA